jgi:hypothetical protein
MYFFCLQAGPKYVDAAQPPPIAHAKFILRATPAGCDIGDDELAAFIYVGSHNFSASAVSHPLERR